MATTKQTSGLFESDVGFEFSKPWGAYWMALLRLIVGFWFLHAGWSKLIDGSFDASFYVGQSGKLLSPVMHLFDSGAGLQFVNFMIPVGETLIGLGLLIGLLVRLAAFFGAFLMVFFWTTNADWSHSLVNSDLFGLLLFVTLIVFGAGRVFGLDAYVERMDSVQRNTWLRYLLG
ncbi:MAG: DoxX family membrane protein [Halapricum sp.]